jgi:NADPH-dependent 2,4-dienoyl-CoA reductase/sulfur reductase-like enzyme
MIDSEADSPYDRPNLSKDYLAGNAPEEWIPIRPQGFYDAHGVQIIRGNATRIDVAQRCVEVTDRPPIPYDALLVATGAEPITLTLPGSDLPHVYYLRSLANSRAIIAATARAKTAVIIGTSFIGLEVAASLRARNIDVHVVAPEAIPLERVLGTELGLFIRSLHEEKGVRFHLGRKPISVDHSVVTLDDGTMLDADMVVIGVGVKPRLALAEQAGLALDRGVTVDEYLETSVPGVFAAGDIARWHDANSGERIRVEHWVHAQRMGQAAARNILGARERFKDIPFFWSAHYDVSINYVGHAERWDTIHVDGSVARRDAVVRFAQGAKTLAVASIFRDEDSLRAELSMEQSSAR